MQSFGDIPLQNRLKRWSKYIAGFILLIAVTVLAGWELEIDLLRSMLSGSKEMNPAAAVAFIFSGISFLLLTSTPLSKSKQNIGKLLAFFVLLIGSAKLFFHISGINLYVDELLFPGKIGTDRIVAIASVCFILAGLSLLLIHTKGKSNEILSDTILLLLVSLSVFSILGYFFQVNLFYGLFTYVPMAVHAAVCFLLISLCIFFYNSDKGLMISLTSTLAGSMAARRLIPAAILVPVLLGILRTVAQQEAVFTIEFGLTILIFTIIVVLFAIIWNNTTLLNKRDLQRQKAERAQHQSEEQIQTIFRAAPDAVIVINEEGTIIKWNTKAEDIFGWQSKEVVGKPLHETIIPQRYREAHKIGLRQFLKSGESPVLGRAFEIQAVNKNNIELEVSLSISPTVVDGKYLFIGFVRDITEQKKAGEQIKESEEKFQKAFQASSAGMSITRLSDATYLDVNEAFTKLTGFLREELIGHTSAQIGMIIDFEKRESVLRQLRESGSSKNFEMEIRDKSGKTLEVLASVETIFLQGEKYALNIIYDITEQKKAEQKFRGLLESAPDAMIIVNEKGAIVLANHQTEVLFGYQKQELIGQQVEMLLPGDLQRKHETHRSNYFKHRRVRSMGAGIELFGVRKDGSRFPVEISLSPLETSEETLVSAAIRDITDRKHAETIIQKQKQDIQDFIDSMSTMCAKVATDGRLLLVNKIAIQASGLSFEELMKTNFLQGQWWTHDQEVHARVCKAFKKACSGIAINYDENIFVFGQILPINFSLMPILGLDGNVDYIVAEGRDIASIKLTEAALQKRTNELELANRELEAFSYSVSHDLRAPLRIIDGYTEIMVNDYGGKLDEEGNKMFGIIRENTAKMGQLIDDLLNLSRLGRKELIIQAVNMKQIVESVVADQGNSKNKQVKIEIGELNDAEGDSNLLRQVWINLVSNAIKYSKGKEKPVIVINSNATAQEITYSIKDNGAGFNMKYVDKLFGVFQRLHKMSEYEGTGVGLALVHRIITRHGGRVWAEAEVNKGATFYFSLPVQKAERTPNLIKQYQTI